MTMTLPIYFTIFWIIGILWTICYWCLENSRANCHRVIFNVNSAKKGSATSIDSLNISENGRNIKRNRQRLNYETKTRWPSRTSMDEM